MADSMLIGSICLTDIPHELIKAVTCKDGKVRKYLSISVVTKKTPQTFTNNGTPRTYTHFISCAPKKEERKEGVNYILGDLETHMFNNAPLAPTVEQINAAPPAQHNDDLPF